MADITPEVSLTGRIAPEVSIGGKVTVPEIVYLQGLQGEKGDPGPKGDTGAQGEQGEKGDAFTYADFTEEQLAALKGPKGDTGAKGDKGDQGPQGEQGNPGEPGAPGADGHTPVITAEKSGKVTTIKVDGVAVATISDGVVSTVNGKTPDDSGNVALTGGDIPMSADDSTTLSAAIGAKLPSAAGAVGTSNLAAEVVTTQKIAPLAITAALIDDKTITRAKMAIDAFTLADNAGAHNAVYRGKNLGSAVTAAQWAAIGAGTFDDLYIGDYWEIGGVNWRIAAFDYYFGLGDTKCITHHVVIVPEANLYASKMNDTNITTGAYVGSKMYTTYLVTAKDTINNAFGSAHILNHRRYLKNATTNGYETGGSWYDSTVELMAEQNLYGGIIYDNVDRGANRAVFRTIDKSQYPLFALRPDLISAGSSWLRDVATSVSFCACQNSGLAMESDASGNLGVRPSFSICA